MIENNDLINHPKHYTTHQSKIECIEITRHLSFNRGNAIKYLWRCGKKDDAQQELQKAIWYLNDEVNYFGEMVKYNEVADTVLSKKLDKLAQYQTDQERQLFNVIIFGTYCQLKQAIKIIEDMCDE